MLYICAIKKAFINQARHNKVWHKKNRYEGL